MRVLELELENFARVYTGLGKLHLLLDLRQLKNRIKLFVGANGTGKTSIMGCIHPYAFNNYTADNRDNGDLIIPEKSGKKRILIQDKNDFYEVTHIYKRDSKGGISVKSFITKNMEELNENGNVGSFKAIVEEVLGITEQYLILLSLGNSIDGFIDMSTSDRKNFIIKLFDELNIYSDLYKKKTSDVRSLKSILGNITYKLDKFKGMNQDDIVKTLSQVDRQIELLEQDLKFNMVEIGTLKGNINTYSDTISQYDLKQSELSIFMSSLESAKRKLVNVDTTEPSILKNNIESIGKEIQRLEINSQALKNNIQSKLDIIDGLNSSISQDTINLNRLETNVSTNDLLTLITKLEIELKEISDIDTSIVEGYEKSELIIANVYLDELMSMMTDLIIFNDDELVIKMVEAISMSPSIEGKLNTLITQSSGKLLDHNMISGSNVRIDKFKKIEDSESPCEDLVGQCPFVRFYHSYLEQMNSNDGEIRDKVNNIRSEISRLELTRDIVAFIKKCNRFMESNIVKYKLPIDVFNPDTFIQSYMESRVIYNSDNIINMIDTLEKMEKKDSIIDKLSMYRNRYETATANKDIVDNLEASLEANKTKIDSHNKEKDKFTEELSIVTSSLLDKQAELIKMESDLDILNTISDIRSSIATITSELRGMSNAMDKINELRERLKSTEEVELSLDRQIKQARINKQHLETTMTELDNLNVEYEDIKYKYDMMMEIRDALSPTKGIPLKFIEDYIRDMATDVNELLYVVYRGRIKLVPEDIVVDDKTFQVPYMSKGTLIPDISNASDGERAIIALAFSLVLSKMSINGYTIMLLDELDTALDDESRGRFIQILETYLDVIGAEDVYIISHNNMFDTYDVSVIMTSDKNVFNIPEEDKLRIY